MVALGVFRSAASGGGGQGPVAVALLLAAGSGERLGAALPKAFVSLAGRPLLQWSLEVLAGSAQIEQVVIAAPASFDVPRAGVPLPAKAVCVQGGAVRSASVRRGLAAAQVTGDGLVLVHDAARPLVSARLVEETLRVAAGEGIDAAIAACPVTDTIKRAADGGGGPPVVQETLDRSGLWAVQTPQVFRRTALERALDVPEDVLAQATDDAWLMERAGGRVAIVASGGENVKVTTPPDLALAEFLLGERAAHRSSAGEARGSSASAPRGAPD